MIELVTSSVALLPLTSLLAYFASNGKVSARAATAKTK